MNKQWGRPDVCDEDGRVIDPEPTMEWHLIHGCKACGRGCERCYAVDRTKRNPTLAHLVAPAGERLTWTGEVFVDAPALADPLAELTPQTWAVSPDGDLLYEGVPDEVIEKAVGVMRLAHWHTFYWLSRRPRRLTGMDLPPNVWTGFSASDQPELDRMWAAFRGGCGAKQFVAIEPMLGPIVLPADALEGEDKLDFVVVMEEAFEGKRPMEVAWLRSLREQCEAAGVPLFWELSSWDRDELQIEWDEAADAGRPYVAAQGKRWRRDLPQFAVKAAGVFPSAAGGQRRKQMTPCQPAGPVTPEQWSRTPPGFSAAGWCDGLMAVAETCSRAAELVRQRIKAMSPGRDSDRERQTT